MKSLVAASVLALAVGGCTADPPPPIESTDSPKPTPAEPTRNAVVVAIDDIGVGFNPHLLADQSPANSAVSSMVLPSPFRPVPSPVRPGGTDWIPDNSMVVSADITNQDPFTITYQLRNEAQWSDGAPIAAEDFRYLWQQMISEPGVVDPAGYNLIQDVGSSGGGKTVTVTMNAPYPAWRELFTDLLPSHLVKDSPGGFARGLAENIPVSGARFHIKSIDRGRDEILLERNDRFWDQPAKPDQILMRRGGTAAQLADSMRSNDAQVTEVHGGTALKGQLAAIPNVRTGVAPQPRVLQFALNGRVGDFGDARVRTGILNMLDPDLLAMVGAETGSNVDPARAQVLSPSDPGYAPTAPPRLTSDRVYALLAEAGYQRPADPDPNAAPPTAPNPVNPITKNGKRLAVRIGAPENDDTAIAVANTISDQLRSAGVASSVLERKADDLYGADLVDGNVDAIVGWSRAGSDPATAMASRFGCPPPAAADSRRGTTGAASTTAATSPTPEANASPSMRAPSNLSGICDPSLQPDIDALLRGTADFATVLSTAEPKLWQLATVLPILQDSTVVAAGPEVGGVSLTGAIQAGIFGDAAGWSRTP
ncbi:ABC transporter family substrate-binding protein [Antrihabitans cavernicola]|uniref:ABC transporter family substrate-binding protein n=1 Tax=Antrihabitans cavernicola TaxID=2495913 RepID=A0A5A7SEY5_9NOCA|nr:ABC transporter family substrate-binding protein [Spelaeibacter cavernicola]KAA0022791.1 ABC transporter family substrate-binding protein [Spelaeibacter cavernicola]